MKGIAVNDSQSLWTPANFVRVVLRGIGQVMFQDNAGTGLLFLIGIAIASPLMAVGALIGAIIGPVTATLAGFDHDEIQVGIYGFNPVLLGTASLFYLAALGPDVGFGCHWIASRPHLSPTSCAAHLSFPTYTAPFVVTTWILILVAHAIAGTRDRRSIPACFRCADWFPQHRVSRYRRNYVWRKYRLRGFCLSLASH